MQHARDLGDHLRPEVAADDVAAERQRQPAGVVGPPLPEVDDLLQPFLGIRQLPFVNQQPHVGLALEHSLLNLVERDDHILEVGLVEPQRQVGGGQRPRNGHAGAADLARSTLAAHDQRTVAITHAGAVRQQRVLVGEMGERMKRHRRHFIAPLERRAVQRLDIGEHLIDDDAVCLDGAVRQAEEHEGVV